MRNIYNRWCSNVVCNMGINVIFLDTNGVLNFTKHREIELRNRRKISFSEMRLSEEALKLVGKLSRETNSLIVVTSSWRRDRRCGSYANLKNQLKSKAGVDIFDTTPVLGKDIDKTAEIEEWFIQNSHLRVDNFVIIDDEDIKCHVDNLVRCDRDYGFTGREVYDKAYNILNRNTTKEERMVI